MKGLSKEEFGREVEPSGDLLSLRDQLKAALKDNESLRTQVADDDALFNAVKDGIRALPKYERVSIPKAKGGTTEHRAVLCLADPHSEDLVKPEEMEGMAAHNYGIHEERMRAVADKTIEITAIMRKDFPVPEATVYLLGDWFLGEIHPDELVGASMPLPVALPMAGRTLADTILRLAANFERVRVVGMVGNHGRTTRKPVFKMTSDRNWDMSVYMIAREFAARAVNVEFVLPRSIMYVDEVMGHKNLVTHGNVCNITHRTPYFGIVDSFNRQHNIRRATDKDFEYAYIGHFHERSLLRDEVYMCPPMLGQDQFGQYKMHGATKPQQLLCFYTEKHGRTAEWGINL